jgi:hypothetical protein
MTARRAASSPPPHARGSALVGVLAALIVLTLVVLSVSAGQGRDQDAALNRLDGALAFYAAEGVANMALREWARNADDDDDGVVGRINSGNVSTGPQLSGARAAAAIIGSASSSTITVSSAGGAAMRSITLSVRRASTDTTPGLNVAMHHLGSCPGNTTNIAWASTPSRIGLAQNIDVPYSNSGIVRWPGAPTRRYGIRHHGTINIPAAGLWTFWTNSDDGSLLFINGTQVVGNDGDHSAQFRSGAVNLPAGPAAIETRYYECGGESVMQDFWQGPTVAAQTLIPASAFSCTPPTPIPGVAAHSEITLSNNARIDAYSSAAGAYGGANVLATANVSVNATASARLVLDSTARISGNALVGPGGNPASVIVTNNSSTITGTRTALTSAIASPQVGLPPSPPSSSGAFSSSSTTTLSVNRRYSSFSLDNSGIINVSGHVYMIVDGGFSMNSTARINIPDGSSLTIYAFGDMSINNFAVLNSGRPANLRIFFMNNGSSFTTSTNAQVSALLNNHRGEVSLNNDTRFFGTILCNELTATSNARIHVDMAALSSAGSGAAASVLSWTQAN